MSPTPSHRRFPPSPAGRIGRSLWRNVRAVGFWTAVALPLVYPFVLAWGASADRARTILIGLLCLHLLALIAGRGHARREDSG